MTSSRKINAPGKLREPARRFVVELRTAHGRRAFSRYESRDAAELTVERLKRGAMAARVVDEGERDGERAAAQKRRGPLAGGAPEGGGRDAMTAIYSASHIKRHRATDADMDRRRADLTAIVDELAPCTVRQVFYQATIRGVVEKTEAGYGKVQRMLADLRRSDELDYSEIVDNTRWMRKARTFDSLQDALDQTASFYRRSLWTEANAYVEVWLEKDALAGVVYPITDSYDVPLMVARGYASLSFLAGAADTIAQQVRPCYIYHLGDFDPSGVDAGEKIEKTLRELAYDAEIHFERIAVNEGQISAWGLPSRPTKTTDSRAARFGHTESVELDAIHPDNLRELVEDAILRHVDKHELDVLRVAEESERQILKAFARDNAARCPP